VIESINFDLAIYLANQNKALIDLEDHEDERQQCIDHQIIIIIIFCDESSSDWVFDDDDGS